LILAVDLNFKSRIHKCWKKSNESWVGMGWGYQLSIVLTQLGKCILRSRVVMNASQSWGAFLFEPRFKVVRLFAKTDR
jgi:hypothetical protein